MGVRLLATIRGESAAKTFSFDEAVQSVLWVGLGEEVGPSDAIVGISAAGGYVVIRPARDVGIVLVGTDYTAGVPVTLEGDSSCVMGLRVPGHGDMSLFVRPLHDGIGRFRKLLFSQSAVVGVGRGRAAGLRYASPYVSTEHARLTYAGGSFVVEDLGSSNGTFVNQEPLAPHMPRMLVAGDVLEVLDLIAMVGDGFLLLNRPPELSVLPIDGTRWQEPTHAGATSLAERAGEVRSPRTFFPAPHLTQTVHALALEVDPPPERKEPEDQPVIMQIGPSFLMGLASVFMVVNSLSGIADGASVQSVAPSVAMALAMVGGSVVWPLVSSSYARRRDALREVQRGAAYVRYLDMVENRLSAESLAQAKVLHEARRPVTELMVRARDVSPLLMSRSPSHGDFLELRVGVGDEPLKADVRWPEHHFAVQEDPMLGKVRELEERQPFVRDVPLAIDLTQRSVVGILGERRRVWEFLRGLLVQVCTLHSYRDVKIVLLAQERERVEWQFLTSLGHLYDDGGETRLVALTHAGLVEQDHMLCQRLDERAGRRAETPEDLGTYYVVVCANDELSQRSEAVRRIESLQTNLAFSLVHLGQDLSDLSRACDFIVGLDPREGLERGLWEAARRPWQSPRTSCMFERSDVLGTMRLFDPDIWVSREEAHDFALHMARVRLDAPERRRTMPESLGFLEMYQLGAVTHLNVGERWAKSDASRTLATPVGMDAHGDVACIDFHEDAHGPHGLVAGTTGSGKSEFIVTLVLSLAVNYAPDEVAFVLIDYKGGGLAGAFSNARHRLPHLAGTITNLDGSTIWRALASVQSELRRRQALFNAARDATGESSVDIHRYLALYRQGILKEPLPHLFVIADEFAELKQKEPDFMDELVSAARIGRSLGVHLVLATQKPTGVVDDQIWSNARLKVSLKVADAADSREMIRRDDAAAIARPGQLYMLVGYDESFMGMQAAYAGGPYVRQERFEPRRNASVRLLDGEGRELVSLRPQCDLPPASESELDAVLGHIEVVAAACGRSARRLWLDPLSSKLVLADLDARYGSMGARGLVLAVGEVDDPANQRKYRYQIDLADVGNVLLYGSPGSGVEEILRSMLLSAAKAHDARCLWLYGIDLGSGGLALLNPLPHMERAVLMGEDERVHNLLRMIRREVTRRRASLVGSGSLEERNERDGETMPRVIVCIVNVAAFMEAYESWEDDLVSLVRDGPRVGVHFVVVAGATGEVRMRLRACFGTEVPTVLNDAADYLSILGGLGRVRPPGRERSGLVCVGDVVLEFQGARIAQTQEEERRVVSEVAGVSSRACDTCAPPIPLVPARVLPGDVILVTHALAFPVGYDKEEVCPVSFDLRASPCMLVLGDDREALARYLRGSCEALLMCGKASCCVVDTQSMLAGMRDDRVIREQAEVEELVCGLEHGGDGVDVIVFTSIVQTLDALDPTVSQRLKERLATECGGGRVAIVAASEAWRTKSVYEDWYRVVSAFGNGVWVGSGFGDQTALRYGRMLPQYRAPAARSDGFMAMQGVVTDVRLVEAEEDGPEGREEP